MPCQAGELVRPLRLICLQIGIEVEDEQKLLAFVEQRMSSRARLERQ